MLHGYSVIRALCWGLSSGTSAGARSPALITMFIILAGTSLYAIPVVDTVFADTVPTTLTVHASGVTESADDSLYVPRSEFTYANNQRYTFLGGRPLRHTNVQTLPLVGMGVAYAAVFTALHIHQTQAWWKDKTGGWHVIEDLEYARWLDKYGHLFAGYAMSTLPADILMEAGVEQEQARWIGAGLGLLYQTYVEVQDGFAANWGFSPSDEIANVAGCTYFLLQYYVPYLENFSPRWSYVPSEWTGGRELNERPKTFIDDYSSTTFWLACNVHNMLPASCKPYWPDWLMLSVGYGIRNYATLDAAGNALPVLQRFMIGLDYNWVKILPTSSVGFLNYLRQCLNIIRFPGPTLEWGDEGPSFKFLYPFQISVPL